MLLNQIQSAINRFQANVGYVRLGIVSSSNPANATIKAKIQPEDVETGFIPYATPWIGWFAPPTPGDQVVLLFQEGDKNVPFGAFLLYGTWNNAIPPAGVVAGEAILYHSSGSFIKLQNNGTLFINGDTAIDVTAPLTEISDGGTTDFLTLFTALKTYIDSHTHTGVTTGGGVSGAPSTPLPSSAATTTLKAQ